MPVVRHEQAGVFAWSHYLKKVFLQPERFYGIV
jgi:hypothetical protein